MRDPRLGRAMLSGSRPYARWRLHFGEGVYVHVYGLDLECAPIVALFEIQDRHRDASCATLLEAWFASERAAEDVRRGDPDARVRVLSTTDWHARQRALRRHPHPRVAGAHNAGRA